MAEASAQEKSEAPTVKRREDSRKEGRVAVSREVSSAALLGVFALYFLVAGEANLMQLMGAWRTIFQDMISEELTVATTQRLFFAMLSGTAPLLMVLFAAAMIVALLSSLVQIGPLLVPLKLQPNRLNPLNGIKRIFSSQGVAELSKSLFKITVIGLVTFFAFRQEILSILTLSRLPVEGIFLFNFQLIGKLFVQVALALVILSVFDYLYQRWHNEQRMKMTKQEVKDELKQTEGDPQLRARVRQVQRDISSARMMENVPKADVVVTNPTHFSVALVYDREVMDSPRLVAKGADYLAFRIREVAKENGVPIVENPMVAREIYHSVEVGQQIPEGFFRIVAEILAYVYRIKGDSSQMVRKAQ